MHSVSYGACPAYLTKIVEPAGAGRTRSGLRSTSSTSRLHAAAAAHKVRGTCVLVRRTVRMDLLAVADPADFRKQLKTHFCTAAYNDY